MAKQTNIFEANNIPALAENIRDIIIQESTMCDSLEDLIKSFRETVTKQFPKGLTAQEKMSLLTAINYNRWVNRWNVYFIRYKIKRLTYYGGELNQLTEEEIIKANREVAKWNKPFDQAWELIANYQVIP
ncbi:hypothetical protein AYK26_01325 [Euryarchaeota archaeon SM23-78]|nr:MAG: hypothetical protein AYK26_01325 [Euryarchaeota archaeon SM23-78]MBW3000627.1 hypothetical protein [Candidatus Woesearchaeota archaeon]